VEVVYLLVLLLVVLQKTAGWVKKHLLVGVAYSAGFGQRDFEKTETERMAFLVV